VSFPVELASRRLSGATLARRFPGATVVDVTSKGPAPWVRFSPFYPHGGVPVPGRPGEVGQSVEGVWQGLKVFAAEGVDPTRWAVASTRGIKRGGKARGPVRGHDVGGTLVDYAAARRLVYLPSYLWVLTHNLAAEVAELRTLAVAGPVVLLDYETNRDVADLSKPLSHAALVRYHLAGTWPGMS